MHIILIHAKAAMEIVGPFTMGINRIRMTRIERIFTDWFLLYLELLPFAAYRLPPTAHHLPPTAYCLPPTASRLNRRIRKDMNADTLTIFSILE
jgi:hypothetical protein